MTQFTTPDTLQQLTDQPAKPQYIHEQHNHGCQQFFGPVTGCVFAMPGANVYQTPSSTKTLTKTKTDSSSKKTTSLPDVSAATIKKARQNKKTAARELMTFRSRGVHEQCLKLLYQQMVKDEWIEARTTCNDFIELFSGDRSESSPLLLGAVFASMNSFLMFLKVFVRTASRAFIEAMIS